MASSDRNPRALGAGHVDGEAVEARMSAAASDVSRTQRAISSWRWPSGLGKMPKYVQSQFQVKVFALLTMQSCVMLAIMVPVHFAVTKIESTGILQVAFATLGICVVVLMVLLRCLEMRYPANCLMLAFVTVFGGIWWGLIGGAIRLPLETWHANYVHFQLMGCISSATCAAMALAAVRPYAGPCGHRCPAAMPLLLGWTVGATAEVLASSFLGIPLPASLAADFISLVLFIILLHRAGKMLADCNPDTFMRVVIAMDSILLVIISPPLLIITSMFCLSSDDDQPEDVPEAVGP